MLTKQALSPSWPLAQGEGIIQSVLFLRVKRYAVNFGDKWHLVAKPPSSTRSVVVSAGEVCGVV